MSLLERANGMTPWHRRTASDDGLYKLTVKYRREIESLRQEGFSWSQVFCLMKAECQANGEWQTPPKYRSETWNDYALQRRYRQVRKEESA